MYRNSRKLPTGDESTVERQKGQCVQFTMTKTRKRVALEDEFSVEGEKGLNVALLSVMGTSLFNL